VTIDTIACNATIAKAVRDAGADYLLAVKNNQPTSRRDIEALFAEAHPASLECVTDIDKAHGRIERRTVTVAHDVDWMSGDRRFPGGLRFPDLGTLTESKAGPDCASAVASTHAIRRLRSVAGAKSRRSPQRTLKHREPVALGARCCFQGGPVSSPSGARGQDHGRRPSFWHQRGPPKRHQATRTLRAQTQGQEPGPTAPRQHQAPPQNSRTVDRHPQPDTRNQPALARIRGPGPCPALASMETEWWLAAPRLITIAINLAEQSKEMRALHVEADTTYRFVRPVTFMARHALR